MKLAKKGKGRESERVIKYSGFHMFDRVNPQSGSDPEGINPLRGSDPERINL